MILKKNKNKMYAKIKESKILKEKEKGKQNQIGKKTKRRNNE